MSKTMKQSPMLNEIYRGAGKPPKTKHAKSAFIIANFGDETIFVETQSERGDTVMGIPPDCEMILDTRVGSFSTDGPAHVTKGKLTKEFVDELDRLEDEEGKETYKKGGYWRPGHPCFVRKMRLYDKPNAKAA